MADLIYKVMTEAAFEASWSQGHFTGSADDLRDGSIHFSAAHQLEATLAKYFAGHEDLVLLAVDPARLGPNLKWEMSRGGALFGNDGVHELPAALTLSPSGRGRRACAPGEGG